MLCVRIFGTFELNFSTSFPCLLSFMPRRICASKFMDVSFCFSNHIRLELISDPSRFVFLIGNPYHFAYSEPNVTFLMFKFDYKRIYKQSFVFFVVQLCEFANKRKTAFFKCIPALYTFCLECILDLRYFRILE